MGPRVPRWPTSGLGRRLLRGSCAPSRRPAVLFPRGCSGFWRPSPLSPSLCLAASPRLPADPVPRPGALVLLRPVVASHPCLPPPARRWCRVPTRGRSSRPTPCAPPAPARVPARARVGSRPSAVALAAARCLRWWLVCGGVGLRPGSPRPRPRGSAAPAGPARAPPSGPPRCVCWVGWSRPSPLGAAAGVPSSAVAGPWPFRLARRLRAGEGRGERGASSRSPRRGPLRSVWGGVATAAAARRRRVCPSVLGTSGPPGDLVPRPSWGARAVSGSPRSYLVDPASSICLSQRLSHACLSTHGWYSETANGSLNQLWFLWSLAPLLLG